MSHKSRAREFATFATPEVMKFPSARKPDLDCSNAGVALFGWRAG